MEYVFNIKNMGDYHDHYLKKDIISRRIRKIH